MVILGMLQYTHGNNGLCLRAKFHLTGNWFIVSSLRGKKPKFHRIFNFIIRCWRHL